MREKGEGRGLGPACWVSWFGMKGHGGSESACVGCGALPGRALVGAEDQPLPCPEDGLCPAGRDLLVQFLPSQWFLTWSSILCPHLTSVLFFGDWWPTRVPGLGEVRRDTEAI